MSGKSRCDMRYLPLALLIGFAGCGSPCAEDGVAGHYQLETGTDVYDLLIETDGTGSLQKNSKAVDSIRWELEPSGIQLFLNVSSATLAMLRELDGSAPPPSKSVASERGYYGMTCVCRSGRTKQLDLDEDHRRSFVRVGDD